MRRVAVLMSLLSLAAAAPAAHAQSSNSIAPPGQSAIDEYLETVPGAGGNTPADAAGGPASPAEARRVVPPATLNRLAREGKDGQAAAALAVGTAPKTGRAAAGKTAKAVTGPDASPGSAVGGSAINGSSDGVFQALARSVTGTGDGGSGPLLPLVLIATALAGVLALVLRRRRPTA